MYSGVAEAGMSDEVRRFLKTFSQNGQSLPKGMEIPSLDLARFDAGRTSVRETILAAERTRSIAFNSNRDKESLVAQKVDLIFQNYDRVTLSGQLTIEEIREIPTPILIADADQNSDEMVSRDELVKYLVRKADENQARARNAARRSSRSSRSR